MDDRKRKEVYGRIGENREETRTLIWPTICWPTKLERLNIKKIPALIKYN